MNATEKDNVFYCDCGFSWRRGMSGSHNCEDGLRAKLTDMAVQLANAESKCRELSGVVAENVVMKEFLHSRVDESICDKHVKIPATDAFMSEVRASAIRDALNESSDYLDTDCVMDRLGISYEDAELRTSGAIELHDALVAVANQLRKGE